MKIGIIGSIWISIPPKNFGFGAQEYLMYYLAEGLKKKKHDVTLFASGDSKTSAKLIEALPTQVSELKVDDTRIKESIEIINIANAYKLANEFDIIHNHLLPFGLPFADLINSVPTVHTLHHEIYKPSDIYLYKKYKTQKLISISQAQRKTISDLNYIATVYNGTDTEYFKFKPEPRGNYLLYLGRMKRYKGIHEAIKLAKKLQVSLKIAAPMPNPVQPDYEEVNQYWEKDIKPQIGDGVEFVGLVEGGAKVKLIQDAKAFIFPVERQEPFGMTLIEAMSCGTPVIAYNNGAIPEIVVDNKTGFLVNQKSSGFEGLCKAVKEIFELSKENYSIMRKNSREHVETFFSIEKMIDNYEKIYSNFV